MSEWIEDEAFARTRPGNSLESIAHLDGVPWYDAPKPRRWHRCVAQTCGYVNREQVERCACGAIRVGFDPGWTWRNQRGSR